MVEKKEEESEKSAIPQQPISNNHKPSNIPEPARLLDSSQFGTTRFKGGFLVAATFAARHATSKGSLDRDDFCIRVEFLDRGSKGMNRSEAKTAQAIGIFQRMKDLVGPDKVFEFGPRLATQTLLEPSFSSLTDFHFGAVGHVRF
jgi:hypothetical protein